MSVNQILILAAYLICWQGYKLRRRVSGLGHIALILSLAGSLANSTTARLSAANPHSLIAGQYIALAEHIFVAISCVGLYVFRLAAEQHTIRSRRVLLTIGGGVVLSLALSVITYFAITRGPLISVSAESYRDPRGFLYAFGSGMYYGLVMFAVAQWMRRSVRNKEKHFRRGMRIASIGIYILSALSIVRAVPIAVIFLGGPTLLTPRSLLGTVSATAFPFIFIGLSYPLLVSRWKAYRVWGHRRQVGKQVRVVWQLCQTAFPEIVLHPGSTLQRAKRTAWNPDELTRLTTESLDGLTKLLIYGAPVDTAPGRAAAEQLRQAVRRYDEAHEVSVREIIETPSGGLDETVPPRPDNDIDVEMLATLAQVLRSGMTDEQERVRA